MGFDAEHLSFFARHMRHASPRRSGCIGASGISGARAEFCLLSLTEHRHLSLFRTGARHPAHRCFGVVTDGPLVTLGEYLL
jgi:hypothetical protein